MACCFSWVTLQ